MPHPIILVSLVSLKRWMWCFIPGVTAMLDRMQRDMRLRWKYIMNHIIEHRETHRPEDEPRDYIHAFLKKQEQEKSEHGTFSDNQLMKSVSDLFLAGTETTSKTLRWAFLYCSIHQSVQEKVFQEISGNFGTEKLPPHSEKSHLPYTEAAIQESLRLGSTVPMTGRALSEDADISGYSVPKGTSVWSNVWGINHDRKNYTQPDKFMAERFIGSDGKLIKDKHHLPFWGR